MNRINKMLTLEDDDVNNEQFLNSLPPGYRFEPTSEELVTFYLKNKIFNKPLPPSKIKETNLYLHSPIQLSEEHDKEGSGIMYFFTQRDQKFPNGKRANRVAGNGFWKASGKAEEVAKFGSLIAYKRSLVYHQHTFYKQATKTDWLMKEFTLTDIRASYHDMKLENWVLCKVYKKKKKPGKEKEDGHVVAFPNSSTMLGEPSQLPMLHEMQAAPSSQMPVHNNGQDNSPMPQNLLVPNGGHEVTQNQSFVHQQLSLEGMDMKKEAIEETNWYSFLSSDREDSEPTDFGGVPILDHTKSQF